MIGKFQHTRVICDQGYFVVHQVALLAPIGSHVNEDGKKKFVKNWKTLFKKRT